MLTRRGSVVRSLVPRRVAVVSVHTSPLAQPGAGDAGGLNVYVSETALRLARRGVDVEVFTRATTPEEPAVQNVAPGVVVRRVAAGPRAPLAKEDLPGQLCAFATGMLATAGRSGGRYDLIHSHYWLSGQVAALVADQWDVPLLHTPHTLARVKQAAAGVVGGGGGGSEPRARVLGEDHLVSVADRHVVNTDDEAQALVDHYGAHRERISVVHPGVDLDVFAPGDRRAARRANGLREQDFVLLFVGRIQPLKGPDLVLSAAAELLSRRPDLRRRLVVVIAGGSSGPSGPSGTAGFTPEGLAETAAALGIGDLVRFLDPMPRAALADLYRAADVVMMPSVSESFGLVALEAQACGTPVVAAGVGGLRTVVRDGFSGFLVDDQDPVGYAAALMRLVADSTERERLSALAVRHAQDFSWDATVDGLLATYRDVLTSASRNLAAVVGSGGGA